MGIQTSTNFITAGKEKSKIDVPISYRIIDLFSQGLYRSPNKAIEELVSNSFDAGATKVHVILPPDLVSPEATITVIDNGTGMDETGLKQLWRIGVSNKRDDSNKFPRNRKQIGKFGIGKLATYVLCDRLTHISKTEGKYHATTMDFTQIPQGDGIAVDKDEKIKLPLRELTEPEAKAALAPFLTGAKRGYKELKLFGSGAAENWTVAIMSDLKEMAREIQRGRLHWILQTAMPLRDDFQLYFNGDVVLPSKLSREKIKSWVLGRDLIKIPNPAPDDLEVTEDATQEKKSPHQFGLTHPKLGRITGYVELYEDLLTGGNSSETGRSHGFFVYVRERLVNIDDEYFGIDSNLLRHGTFARFRLVVYIDQLDEELRSSRESVREGTLIEIVRNILHGVFNYIRTEHTEFERTQAPGVQTVSRISASPASLARQPLIGLVTRAFEGKYNPKYTTYPANLSPSERSKFITDLEAKAETSGVVSSVKFVDNLSQDRGIAIFDAETCVLQVNELHPFVATFLDEYQNQTRSTPLELIAMSEVLLEAHLIEANVDPTVVEGLLSRRDELLRHLSRSNGRRNAYQISIALMDASTNKSQLEIELVAAFDSIGFAGAIPIRGSGKPDGYAEAHLSGSEDGEINAYKLTLEAKSKEKQGAKVTAKAVGISTIARHRDGFNADYAVVVGPDFPTTKGDKTALATEIKADREKNRGKGITLVRIEDMARLVRLVPAKRVGLKKLRELFKTCSLPEDAQKWIEQLNSERMEKPPYKELLNTIFSEQKDMPGQNVEYGSIITRLRMSHSISLTKEQVVDLCRALSKMAPEYVFTTRAGVEIHQRPDKILQAISSTIGQYPEEEQKKIVLPK